MAIVRFDPPSLRKHDRVTAPAAVILDNVRYETLQWSPGGFCIQGYRGSAGPGDQRSVRFMLNFHGFEVGFNAKIEVCRVEPDTETLAARYLELGEREQELLKHFLSGLVSGQIGVVGDTIRHLDIPLHSLPAPALPSHPASTWQRTRELAGRSLLYLIIGPIVLGFALLAIYRSFFHLEVQTAVVARPIESLVSVGTGRISEIYVREGQTVAQNEKVFSVVDEATSRDLEEARLDRDRARADLLTAQAARSSGNQRIDVYKSITANKQIVATKRVEAARGECANAKNHLDRVQSVFNDGLESEAIMDQAKSEYARAKGALEETMAELKIADDAVRAAGIGIFYDGLRLVDEGPQLRGAEDGARVRARLAEERLEAAEARATQLTCRAPFAGSVVRVVKGAGSTVGRGEEIAFIEHMVEAPRIQALLSQDEVTRVKVGARVTVQIPALGRSYPATVERVDRANLLANPLLTNPALRPAWGGLSDRTAWMSIALDHLSPDDKISLRSGMPAVVTMEKEQMTSQWNQMIASIRSLARW